MEGRGGLVFSAPTPGLGLPFQVPGPESAFARLLSAVCGSVLTSFALTPLDVAKTRMQVAQQAPEAGRDASTTSTRLWRHVVASCGGLERWDKKSGAAPRNTVEAVRGVYAKEGVTGLYAGLTTTFAMAVPSNVMYFAAYECLRDELHALDVPATPLVAGCAARTVSVTLTAPFEVAGRVATGSCGCRTAERSSDVGEGDAVALGT